MTVIESKIQWVRKFVANFILAISILIVVPDFNSWILLYSGRPRASPATHTVSPNADGGDYRSDDVVVLSYFFTKPPAVIVDI